MVYVAAGVVVFLGIFVYVLFMIFLPEWVGITGKTALRNEREHLGDLPKDAADNSSDETRLQNKSGSSNPPKL